MNRPERPSALQGSDAAPTHVPSSTTINRAREGIENTVEIQRDVEADNFKTVSNVACGRALSFRRPATDDLQTLRRSHTPSEQQSNVHEHYYSYARRRRTVLRSRAPRLPAVPRSPSYSEASGNPNNLSAFTRPIFLRSAALIGASSNHLAPSSMDAHG